LRQEAETEPVVTQRPLKAFEQPQCIKRKLVAGVNDLATTHPEVAALWDEERNGELTPEQILAGSNRKVWWRCGKGHSWEAPPFALTINGSRCPYCAGKKVIPGETDLATRYPEIVWMWDSERNSEDPRQVMPGTKKKFWWRCKQGHHWQAAAYAVTLLHSGCPYCAGKTTARKRGQSDKTQENKLKRA